MRIMCISRYRSGEYDLEAGAFVDAQDAECERLMRDSPGSFEVVGASPPPAVEPEPAPDREPEMTEPSPRRRRRGG
jgi:hypothetical protein